MSDETTNPTAAAHKPRQRTNAALSKSIDDLNATVDRLDTTVFQSAGKINAFIEESRADRRQLNDRVAVLENGALSRDQVKSAVSDALTEQRVVTQDTLGTTAYRQIVGGTRRILITLGAISAGVGGAAVAIQHIVNWVLH